ncbi:hypothetical protein FC15_GL000686 [Lapidilactobacillus concavus DSM 17758]|uniref:HTH cro/C1-type domain-containing protein n=1 Tax=Lapidilactobacillus concavus DSM 17758 TaxID=1423735 RepID=A0A0R1VYN7_9LACO|nr:hypothetical protein [Lapidilactobacillus concavus]KRM08179.1 hypothetical protein FC15_GL000686 [Lapidilactobacillus concavus DSM 17758]GEL14081.1 hypothetical protein LCO01nite_16300 [Lapidilactobacillus concavus]
MPTALTGRQLIKQYVDQHNVDLGSLGAMYGIGKVYMGEIISGKKQTRAANALVLKIIDDFKLRPNDD